MAITVGQSVSIRGTLYRVVDARNLNNLGAKFWGKYVFTLTAPDGSRVEVFGKTIGGNSKVRPARPTR